MISNQLGIGFQRGFPRQRNSLFTWLLRSCSSPLFTGNSDKYKYTAELPFQAMPQGRPNFTLTQMDAFASSLIESPQQKPSHITIVGTHK